MNKTLDVNGKRFGRLFVISKAGKDKNKYVTWNCICDCGNNVVVRGASLNNGNTKSCGCLIIDISTTHGMRHTPTYKSWAGIKQRCNNKNNKNYGYYGGRGISICERWEKFENFYSDMGKIPQGMTIERIDNNDNYKPSNCVWATRKEQARNRRRQKIIIIKGEQKCESAWAEHMGISRETLRSYLNMHSPEEALIAFT